MAKKGNIPEAVSVLNTALELYPNYAKALILLGVLTYQSGGHESGVQYVARAVESEPGDATPVYLEAMAAHKKREHGTAFSHFQELALTNVDDRSSSTSDSARSITHPETTRPRSRRSNRP